jgi:hypothetical protein
MLHHARRVVRLNEADERLDQIDCFAVDRDAEIEFEPVDARTFPDPDIEGSVAAQHSVGEIRLDFDPPAIGFEFRDVVMEKGEPVLLVFEDETVCVRGRDPATQARCGAQSRLLQVRHRGLFGFEIASNFDRPQALQAADDSGLVMRVDLAVAIAEAKATRADLLHGRPIAKWRSEPGWRDRNRCLGKGENRYRRFLDDNCRLEPGRRQLRQLAAETVQSLADKHNLVCRQCRRLHHAQRRLCRKTGRNAADFSSIRRDIDRLRRGKHYEIRFGRQRFVVNPQDRRKLAIRSRQPIELTVPLGPSRQDRSADGLPTRPPGRQDVGQNIVGFVEIEWRPGRSVGGPRSEDCLENTVIGGTQEFRRRRLPHIVRIEIARCRRELAGFQQPDGFDLQRQSRRALAGCFGYQHINEPLHDLRRVVVAEVRLGEVGKPGGNGRIDIGDLGRLGSGSFGCCDRRLRLRGSSNLGVVLPMHGRDQGRRDMLAIMPDRTGAIARYDEVAGFALPELDALGVAASRSPDGGRNRAVFLARPSLDPPLALIDLAVAKGARSDRGYYIGVRIGHPHSSSMNPILGIIQSIDGQNYSISRCRGNCSLF